MRGKKVLESSASEHWGTPDPVANGIQAVWGIFDLDAAASKDNAKAEEWFDEEEDGLKQSWFGVTFCNPPFNLKKKMRVDPWIAKARHETERTEGDLCRRAILLVPARTSNRWWHEHVMGVAAYVIFVKGRIKFTLPGKKNCATFPSVIIIFDPETRGLNGQTIFGAWTPPKH